MNSTQSLFFLLTILETFENVRTNSILIILLRLFAQHAYLIALKINVWKKYSIPTFSIIISFLLWIIDCKIHNKNKVTLVIIFYVLTIDLFKQKYKTNNNGLKIQTLWTWPWVLAIIFFTFVVIIHFFSCVCSF